MHEQNEIPSAAGLKYALESGGDAKNYYRWLTEVLGRDLSGRVLEHGAGTGTLSAALLASGLRTLVLTEPDEYMAGKLRERFGSHKNVEVFQGTLDDYLRCEGPVSIDAIVSSNVLEHVQDDEACLSTMWAMLRPGGKLSLYVPARPELYGPFDANVGHFRRYGREELKQKLIRARFEIAEIQYRNLIGALGLLATSRLLRKKTFGGPSIQVFDRVIFPLSRLFEDRFPPPYGMNLLALAAKGRS